MRAAIGLAVGLAAAKGLAALPGGKVDAEPTAALTLAAPQDYQVVQRTSATVGTIPVAGTLTSPDAGGATIEARITSGGRAAGWQALARGVTASRFDGKVEAPAGGWHRVEVRVVGRDRRVIAEAKVEHVGVGEVFVVAGQSNSANHGEEKQTTQTGRVAAFDGTGWRLAVDPQPGASGTRGSFLPPLGDLLVARFGVPVGFVPCGVGSTSVREWLPQGATFPNPPTLERRVLRRPDGRWESKGEAYATLIARMKQLGPQGFRAVLWHQGESDANQKDPTRTFPGPLYREALTTVIRESRRTIGWEAPWFVAQASYHSPTDEGSPEIRAAQAALGQDGTALAGPDSDALKGAWRERQGQGVHFSGPGLREHAARWMDKIAPWLEARLR